MMKDEMRERERERAGRLAPLDSLRGLAALAIACVFHLGTIPFYYPAGLPLNSIYPINWIYRNGALFVEFFLVISGFVTCAVYTDRIDSGMDFKRYAAKRAIRIYPLMIVTLILSVIEAVIWFLTHEKTFWWGGGAGDSLTTLVFSVLGLQQFYPGAQCWNYPSWSLSVFFICWIIYFLLIYATRKDTKDRRFKRMTGCLVLVLIGIGIQYNGLMKEYALLNMSASRGYIAFFSGCLLYYLNLLQKKENVNRNVALSLGALGLLVLLRVLGIGVGNYTILFGAVIFPLLIYIVLNVKFLYRAMSLRPLTFLGRISFSIYLCNYPIELAFVLLDERFGWNISCSTPTFMLSYIIVHILIGTLFCFVFEEKIPKKLKSKFGI